MTTLTHYFDLKVIPQVEMTSNMVISALYQETHLLLPMFRGKIGLGFPAFGLERSLGGIFRLFGSESDSLKLHQLMTEKTQFTDYAVVTKVCEVPQAVKGYAHFHRVHSKGQSDLRRSQKRLTAQGKWSDEVANRMIKKWGKPMKYPHVHLKSHSNGQKFILWIQKTTANEPLMNSYSAYGLSHQATVPLF